MTTRPTGRKTAGPPSAGPGTSTRPGHVRATRRASKTSLPTRSCMRAPASGRPSRPKSSWAATLASCTAPARSARRMGWLLVSKRSR